MLPPNICGVKISVDPDTGTDVDLIPSDFKKVLESNSKIKKHIRKPEQRIYTPNCNKIDEEIARKKEAKLSNDNAETCTDIYIIGHGIHKYQLLSEKALIRLGLF